MAPWRIGVALVFLAGVGVGLGAPATAARRPVDTKRMVLRLRDLPSGFVQTEGRYLSNRQAAKESPVKDYVKLGRLTGYVAEFRRSGRLVVGVLRISTSANLYRTASDASASLAVTERGVAKERSRVSRLPLRGKLGDEAVVYLERLPTSGYSVDIYSVLWRSRRVLAVVSVGVLERTTDPGKALALARKQQRRIVAATH